MPNGIIKHVPPERIRTRDSYVNVVRVKGTHPLRKYSLARVPSPKFHELRMGWDDVSCVRAFPVRWVPVQEIPRIELIGADNRAQFPFLCRCPGVRERRRVLMIPPRIGRQLICLLAQRGMDGEHGFLHRLRLHLRDLLSGSLLRVHRDVYRQSQGRSTPDDARRLIMRLTQSGR